MRAPETHDEFILKRFAIRAKAYGYDARRCSDFSYPRGRSSMGASTTESEIAQLSIECALDQRIKFAHSSRPGLQIAARIGQGPEQAHDPTDDGPCLAAAMTRRL